MKLVTELYPETIKRIRSSGQHILAHQQEDLIVVYQAYNHRIADYAVKNQKFGGDYSYNRMSWIKPNFLWMMYRCGWAEKENQERVLALWLEKKDFESILEEAVISSFNPKYYNSQEDWKKDLEEKEVRLQWDPDHDPYGNKMERRAIQLGLKGKILERFGKEQIRKIDDITDFVKDQKKHVDEKNMDQLLVPFETLWLPANVTLRERIGISMPA